MIALIILVGLGLLAWFILSDDDTTEAETEAPSSEGTIVTDDGTDILTAAGNDIGDLGAFEGESVVGTTVDVVEVTSSVGLWVGDGDARWFVVPSAGTGGISEDDEIDLSGVIRVLPLDYAERFDVSSDDDEALQAMGYYIDAHELEVAA